MTKLANKPMPKCAYPVRDYLRKKVKRPRTLPRSWGEDEPLRWRRNKGECCPLGLIQGASPSPTSIGHSKLPLKYEESMHAFINWWDNQKDPEFAVKEVWGC